MTPSEVKTIILDLDGPVLDGKLRHYTCYESILKQHGYSTVNKNDYWQMKREKKSLQEILTLSGATSIDTIFRKLWTERIESGDLLKLDRIQQGVFSHLTKWRKQGKQLILATLRNNSSGLFDQLKHLELEKMFGYIAVCPHHQGGLGKAQKIINNVEGISPENTVWIGDTEVDIEGARAFGCPIYAVSCGVRSVAVLYALKPDFLVDSLTCINA